MTEARDAGETLRELAERMRSDGPRYKSHDLGFVDSVGVNTVEDWADELEQAAATLRAEHDRLVKDLAECYRLTGADPDGNDDRALAPLAVVEVRRLRDEEAQASMHADDLAKQVRALRQALEEILGHWYHQRVIDATDDDQKTGRRPCPLVVTPTIADVRRWRAALALPGEAAQQPAGSFGYCATCYHPLDRCSHCEAGEAAPTDEEWVPHAFTPDVNRAVDQDGPIWCAQCAYHRESGIHAVCGEAAQETQK